MRTYKILVILTFLSACNHSPVNQKLSEEWRPLTKTQQKKLIRKSTQEHQEYDGLHLSFDTRLTFLNSGIRTNNLKIQSQFKNWTPDTAIKEKQGMLEELRTSAKFFLTFYTPKTKRNKLNQEAADWKAIVRINNREHEGVIKLRDNLTHHNKVYYPEINPWSTPYMVSFPVSTTELESSKFEVVVMGPEGMALFKF